MSRAASKRDGKHGAVDLPGRMITIPAAAQSISSVLRQAPSASSPPHLRQLYGVLRI